MAVHWTDWPDTRSGKVRHKADPPVARILMFAVCRLTGRNRPQPHPTPHTKRPRPYGGWRVGGGNPRGRRAPRITTHNTRGRERHVMRDFAHLLVS